MSTKTLEMGLGEAIERLNILHSKKGRGIASSQERAEHALILQALNQTKLDMGFDCNLDGIPDSIQIFAESANTSCCRILSTKNPRRKKSSSRRSL